MRFLVAVIDAFFHKGVAVMSRKAMAVLIALSMAVLAWLPLTVRRVAICAPILGCSYPLCCALTPWCHLASVLRSQGAINGECFLPDGKPDLTMLYCEGEHADYRRRQEDHRRARLPEQHVDHAPTDQDWTAKIARSATMIIALLLAINHLYDQYWRRQRADDHARIENDRARAELAMQKEQHAVDIEVQKARMRIATEQHEERLRINKERHETEMALATNATYAPPSSARFISGSDHKAERDLHEATSLEDQRRAALQMRKSKHANRQRHTMFGGRLGARSQSPPLLHQKPE